VRDGIAIARNGIPAVAFVTSKFWPQGDFVAKAVAGIGREAMALLADSISEEVLQRLTNG
jgi:hypothetical protein